MKEETKEVLKDMIDALINKKDEELESHFHNYLQDKSQDIIKAQQAQTHKQK